MRALRHGSVVLVLASLLQLASPASLATDPGVQPHTGAHDGSHDFDFDFGTWKTHSARLLHPLTGSQDWVEMDGVTVVTQIWDGRANLAEYRATGPTGVVELLALRVYNPKSGQWSINFATPGALFHLGCYHGGGPLRAGVLGRRRQDLGGELDHPVRPSQPVDADANAT